MSGATERPGPSPVFHEKRTYRLRRLMDAARLAPVLALLLWLLPLFWPQSGDARISSSVALIYIFAVWVAVIALTGALTFALGRNADDDTDVDP